MNPGSFSVRIADIDPDGDGLTIGLANIHAVVPDVAANQRRIREALICHDLCFPALLHVYQFVDNVDAIVLQASWWGPAIRQRPVTGSANTHYYGYLWDTLIPAQAGFSQIWFFAANAVGCHNISNDVFWGGSGIWTPSRLSVLRASNHAEELIILRHIPVKAEREMECRDFDYSEDFAAAGLSEPYRAEAVVVNAR